MWNQRIRCDYYGQERKTTIHLFCDCPKINHVWKDIVDWLNSLEYRLGYLTDVQIMFGAPTFYPIINKIIIATKFLIFRGKTKLKELLLQTTIHKKDFGVYGRQYRTILATLQSNCNIANLLVIHYFYTIYAV